MRAPLLGWRTSLAPSSHAVGDRDLAGAALPHVVAPTLLLVGGRDTTVIHLNEAAYVQLRCQKVLEIVPEATHLFEEPGALATRSAARCGVVPAALAPPARTARVTSTRTHAHE